VIWRGRLGGAFTEGRGGFVAGVLFMVGGGVYADGEGEG